MNYCLRLFVFLISMALSVTPVQAHPHHSHLTAPAFQNHGFTSGFFHPLSGADHLMAMVAVGILSVQLDGRALCFGPLSFLSGIVMGGLIGLTQGQTPAVERVIALSLVVMGIAMVLKKVPPEVYLYAAFAMFGSFHGYAHATEISSGGQIAYYTAGFVAGSALLHAAGIVLGVLFKNSRNALLANAMRCSGAGIAAAGVFFAL